MAGKSKIRLATEEVSEQFEEKMHTLALKEREREVEQDATAAGLPYLDVQHFPINREALELIPEAEARRLKLVPLLVNEEEIRLGTTDYSNPELKPYLESLRQRQKGHYLTYLISEHSLELVLRTYAGMAKIRPVVTGVTISEAEIKKYQGTVNNFKRVNELLQDATLTELVTILIAGALELRASDIHVEAEEAGIAVRYRIDGALYQAALIKQELWPQITSRLKLLSKLKINITTEPQDGRFTIHLSNDTVEVRVSTIPTAYGESVVMRLLRSSATGLQFDDLGLTGQAYEDLKREIKRPNGMIMTTGPTGSGKTTTLYAILNNLNRPEIKIITLEDPIEYKLKGVNQSQVDHAKGYDFARGLKAVLRQDPDVVMVGEIRDFETADVAINAALTGHLVLSTVHTNSAAGAIPRFLAMGAKAFLLAPALNCVVGQRLVRRICPDCKEEDKLDSATTERIKKLLSGITPKSEVKVNPTKLSFHRGNGCAKCGHLGYRGRVGIYEIMNMNPEVEKIIFANKASEAELQEIAVKNGMVTMVQDGLLKALQGITTVDEVFRVAE
ncbi:MAG: GspE/PulE family protein [Candidatus Veblenbacteria bacterium]|nr:GspE/PulE family protein [Candidatus Veblenbacteria bacterium]